MMINPAQRHSPRFIRYFMLVSAVLYSLGGLVRWSQFPDHFEPIGQRLALASFVIALAAASWFSPRVARWLPSIFEPLLLLVSFHVYYIMLRNDFSATHIAGNFLTATAVGHLLTGRPLARYFALKLSLTAALLIHAASAGSDTLRHLCFLFAGYLIISAFRLLSYASALANHRKLEQQRLVAQQAAKWASLGQLAGGIAHEINNPLGAVFLMSSVLRDELKEGTWTKERVEPILDRLEKTAERMQKFIDSLRVYTRQETISLEKIDVAKAVAEAADLLGAEIRRHGIDFRFQAPAAPDTRVDCNESQLVQALLYIIHNALDAAADSVERKVSVDLQTDADGVWIRVADSGPGVPAALRDAIFEPLFTTKPPGQGTGFGLSISRQMISRMGGKLILERGQPTTFAVYLPREQAVSTKRAS